jgi:hypothetical protein
VSSSSNDTGFNDFVGDGLGLRGMPREPSGLGRTTRMAHGRTVGKSPVCQMWTTKLTSASHWVRSGRSSIIAAANHPLRC